MTLYSSLASRSSKRKSPGGIKVYVIIVYLNHWCPNVLIPLFRFGKQNVEKRCVTKQNSFFVHWIQIHSFRTEAKIIYDPDTEWEIPLMLLLEYLWSNANQMYRVLICRTFIVSSVRGPVKRLGDSGYWTMFVSIKYNWKSSDNPLGEIYAWVSLSSIAFSSGQLAGSGEI